jgi:hypothetical protein
VSDVADAVAATQTTDVTGMTATTIARRNLFIY